MNLSGTQLKDTYGNLLTIGTTAGSPTTGGLQNGDGSLLTSVGIGTNSPSVILEVKDNNPQIQLTDSVNASAYSRILNTDSGTLYIDADLGNAGSNSAILFRLDGGNEKMRIEGGGDISFRDTSNNQAFYWDASEARLGIGTDSPDALLHIESNGNSVIRLTDNDVTVEDGSIAGKIEFENNDSSGGLNAYIAGINEGVAGDIGLSFATGSGGSASPRMTIDSSGNVGIGTSPSEKLEVQDGFISVGSSTNTSTTNALLSGYGYILSGTKIGNTSIKSTYNNSNNSASLEFYTDPNGSTPTERLRIDSSGNTSIYSGVLNLGTDSVASSLNCIGDVFNIGVDSDGNTGGSPSIRFNVSGSEKARIDSSGNVGINTTGPTSLGGGAKLTVNQATDGNIVFARGGSTRQVQLGTTSTTGYINADNTSGGFTFNVNASERMRITSDGDIEMPLNSDAVGRFVDNVGEVGSGNFALQVTNSANSALKPLGFRAEDIRFATGSSEKMRILSGGGITFNGDTATANALDDYEEGTFTPKFVSSTDSNDNVTNSRAGYYTKIGDIVYITVNLISNDLSGITGTDQVILDDLPFTAKDTSSGNDQAVTIGQYRFLATTDHTAIVQNGTDQIAFTTDGFVAATYSSLFSFPSNTGTSIKISAVYKTT
jgi:hypothetical protein